MRPGEQIIPDQCAAVGTTFQDFVDALPENDCRYAVYDFEYTNADGCIFKKIIFVMWSPDNAATKSKMMYASSKDFLKNLLPGIAVEQQATEKGEVDEEDMRLRIQATITRK
jgi:cofilin